MHGVAIAGPKSRKLLQRITRDDVWNGALRFRDVRRTFVGCVPVILVRISFSGELGYELYCEPQILMALWERIEHAGADLGVRPYGARALMSLRLEKYWGGSGRWTTAPITPQRKADSTPSLTGSAGSSAASRRSPSANADRYASW